MEGGGEGGSLQMNPGKWGLYTAEITSVTSTGQGQCVCIIYGSAY